MHVYIQVKKIALRKRMELVTEFKEDVSVFRAEEPVFIDETFYVCVDNLFIVQLTKY